MFAKATYRRTVRQSYAIALEAARLATTNGEKAHYLREAARLARLLAR